MHNVVRFERSRSRTWLRLFYGIVSILCVLFGMFLWISWKTITDLQGWDLLTIFTQDREIISDYWQDTVMTFIAELPLETVFWAVGILIVIVVIVWMTRKRRKIVHYRMRELAKHTDIRKNS